VLGDLTASAALSATTPPTVTWWASSWFTLNTLSSGPAPSSFKGFAQQLSTTPPACGGTWTTTTGNSPPPPATVPREMAVIVSSKIVQTGHTIMGDIAAIVLVKTNPGYAPNPGHAGTGTVTGVLCQSQPIVAPLQRRSAAR
jgi:hypothetical protein